MQEVGFGLYCRVYRSSDSSLYSVPIEFHINYAILPPNILTETVAVLLGALFAQLHNLFNLVLF